jgi:hypothetical protein
MNDFYKISKDSLVELSKRIYEEACMGYMDLRDSACEKLVEEFLDDKDTKKEDSTPLSAGAVLWTLSPAGDWDGGIGVPTTIGSDYVVGTDPALETAGLSSVTITMSSNIPQVGISDIVLRNPDEDMLRRETTNYFGNESERM